MSDPLHLHYLVINYQNKLIQLKQEDKIQASMRHEMKAQFREASFYYYNSIRLQLCQKERRNTLSYIGFLIGKDVSSFSKDIPQNITLQTIV